jgi:hypothetical protein
MIAVRNPRGDTLPMVMMLALSACASAPNSPPPPVPVAAAPVLDASYDWHGLLLLPFGTVLKEVPFTLHEVLLFRDASHAAQGDDAECYAMEQAAPRFLARTPSTYLLCFRHDRLARVEATVNLPQDEAARIFSDACELWTRAGTPAASGEASGAAMAAAATAPAATASTATASTATASTATASIVTASEPGACEGRDGVIGYDGRLEKDADRTDSPLTIRLDALAQP